MVHRIMSSSNLEVEEGRDTSNGARSLAALNVAVLGLLLITEVLILDWGPAVTKQEFGVLIASIIVVYVLGFTAWIRLGRPGIFHGRMARMIPVFMSLLALIFNVIVATRMQKLGKHLEVEYILYILDVYFARINSL